MITLVVEHEDGSELERITLSGDHPPTFVIGKDQRRYYHQSTRDTGECVYRRPRGKDSTRGALTTRGESRKHT